MYSWPTSEKGKEISGCRPACLASHTDQRTQHRDALEPRQRLPARAQIIEAAKLEKELALLESTIPRRDVSRAVKPAEPASWRAAIGGRSGEIVEPAIPAFLGKVETGRARGN